MNFNVGPFEHAHINIYYIVTVNHVTMNISAKIYERSQFKLELCFGRGARGPRPYRSTLDYVT